MNKSVIACVAVLALGPAFAAGDEQDELLEQSEREAENQAIASRKVFYALPKLRRVEGPVSVRKPGAEWADAEEGLHYPFGTAFRAGKGASFVVAFGDGSSVSAAEGASFSLVAQKPGEKSRSIALTGGEVSVLLPDNLQEGMFFVTAPGFTVKNPAGESKYVYTDKGDGDLAQVRCVTGSLALEGRHFEVAAMHAADELSIRTCRDSLSTVLTGVAGTFVGQIDQGERFIEEFDDEGNMKSHVGKGTLDWKFSPGTRVLINRALPAIGSRMSVHTMAFDALGGRKSECYFCEGRPEINSGELVPKAKLTEEDLAKRTAEETETTAAAETEDAAVAE